MQFVEDYSEPLPSVFYQTPQNESIYEQRRNKRFQEVYGVNDSYSSSDSVHEPVPPPALPPKQRQLVSSDHVHACYQWAEGAEHAEGQRLSSWRSEVKQSFFRLGNTWLFWCPRQGHCKVNWNIRINCFLSAFCEIVTDSMLWEISATFSWIHILFIPLLLQIYTSIKIIT